MMDTNQPTTSEETKVVMNGEDVPGAEQDEQNVKEVFRSPVTEPMLQPEVFNTELVSQSAMELSSLSY